MSVLKFVELIFFLALQGLTKYIVMMKNIYLLLALCLALLVGCKPADPQAFRIEKALTPELMPLLCCIPNISLIIIFFLLYNQHFSFLFL